MPTIRFTTETWELLQHAMAKGELPNVLVEQARKDGDRIVVQCPDDAVAQFRNFFNRQLDQIKARIDDAVRHGTNDSRLSQEYVAVLNGLKALDETNGVASRGGGRVR
jgi:hypothetical protein